MTEKITKKIIEDDVMRVVGEKDKENEFFKISCILLASAAIGPNEKAIAELLKYELKFVNQIGAKAKKHGIWTKDGKICCEWDDKKYGGISFILDTMVIGGLVKRVEDNTKSKKKHKKS